MLDAALVQHARDRRPLHALQPGAQVVVGAPCNPIGCLRIGRAAGWRVVLETTIARRVMRRSNHNAVGTGVGQNRVGYRRSRGIAAAIVDANLQLIGQQHLEGGDHGGLG